MSNKKKLIQLIKDMDAAAKADGTVINLCITDSILHRGIINLNIDNIRKEANAQNINILEQEPQIKSLQKYNLIVIDDTVINPFHITPEMLIIGQEITEKLKTEEEKARALFEYVIKEIRYGSKKRGEVGYRTSKEVSATEEGVCGEQAIYYIPLARSVGLQASYVSVTIDETGKKANHACAAVWINERPVLVDTTRHSDGFDIKHKEWRIKTDKECLKDFKQWRKQGQVEQKKEEKIIERRSITRDNIITKTTGDKAHVGISMEGNSIAIGKTTGSEANVGDGMKGNSIAIGKTTGWRAHVGHMMRDNSIVIGKTTGRDARVGYEMGSNSIAIGKTTGKWGMVGTDMKGNSIAIGKTTGKYATVGFSIEGNSIVIGKTTGREAHIGHMRRGNSIAIGKTTGDYASIDGGEGNSIVIGKTTGREAYIGAGGEDNSIAIGFEENKFVITIGGGPPIRVDETSRKLQTKRLITKNQNEFTPKIKELSKLLDFEDFLDDDLFETEPYTIYKNEKYFLNPDETEERTNLGGENLQTSGILKLGNKQISPIDKEPRNLQFLIQINEYERICKILSITENILVECEIPEEYWKETLSLQKKRLEIPRETISLEITRETTTLTKEHYFELINSWPKKTLYTAYTGVSMKNSQNLIGEYFKKFMLITKEKAINERAYLFLGKTGDKEVLINVLIKCEEENPLVHIIFNISCLDIDDIKKIRGGLILPFREFLLDEYPKARDHILEPRQKITIIKDSLIWKSWIGKNKMNNLENDLVFKEKK